MIYGTRFISVGRCRTLNGTASMFYFRFSSLHVYIASAPSIPPKIFFQTCIAFAWLETSVFPWRTPYPGNEFLVIKDKMLFGVKTNASGLQWRCDLLHESRCVSRLQHWVGARVIKKTTSHNNKGDRYETASVALWGHTFC